MSAYFTEAKLRTFVRSLTWRISGVALTVLLTWYFAGDIALGVELGVTYNAIRLSTHYFHDRLWARVRWGMQHHEGEAEPPRPLLRGRLARAKEGNGNGRAAPKAEPLVAVEPKPRSPRDPKTN